MTPTERKMLQDRETKLSLLSKDTAAMNLMRKSTLYPGGSNFTANQVGFPKAGSNNQSSGLKKGEREIQINSDDEDADKKRKRKLQEAEQRVS